MIFFLYLIIWNLICKYLHSVQHQSDLALFEIDFKINSSHCIFLIWNLKILARRITSCAQTSEHKHSNNKIGCRANVALFRANVGKLTSISKEPWHEASHLSCESPFQLVVKIRVVLKAWNRVDSRIDALHIEYCHHLYCGIHISAQRSFNHHSFLFMNTFQVEMDHHELHDDEHETTSLHDEFDG